ncbi:homer protein homolog 2-like isoform X2 [Patiria miniata]|uniref:WH1 domain-containing protein n=1 Tax=Patiria miniata TaxID=46514 RepID=A0A914BLE1_PATMI|nr:homer protein homolog 2-like isoform X2 [Patiria miniata]XP_038076743.1 homer protein homolog 2-like isoform X2 [Patiria miniata]XP_038076745.1 homer protein homolog 2-like isoform X2 [Patiria miniata]
MGEQPIFNTRAHVFQIDPVTKKNWLPSSKQAVNVSFFYDSTRSSYRIISVDGSKAIINSTMVPQMMFTKTSQKFGQWADNRANTVYGLGFSSEAELNKFIEQFDNIKEQMKSTPQDKKGGGGGDSGITANGTPRASVVSTAEQPVIKHTKERSGDNTPISTVPASTSNDAQVRYENDRLKIALAQSSNNAKKWEGELQTLKNNNARLTTALQESASNVEEWKKQLSAYKEENARLKQKLQEAPQATQGTPGSPRESQDTRVKELEEKVQSLALANKDKTNEAEELANRLQQVMETEEEGKKLRQELQDSKEAQATLQKRVEELQERLKREQSGRQHDTHRAQQLHSQLGNLIQELSGMHQDMAEIL